MRQGSASAWALSAILAVGLALRLAGFASFPFWEDELYTISESAELFDSAIPRGTEARPLYFALQHVLSFVVPETPVGLRAAPLLFGMAGIWVTWLIGARLFGVTAGLVAAALVAIAPSHLYMSQMARFYSLLYLLGALFCSSLVRACRTDRPRDYGIVLLVLATSLLTHPVSLFPVVGAALGCSLVTPSGSLGWSWPSRTAWIYLWGPCALGIAAWYGILQATDAFLVPSAQPRSVLGTLRLVPAVLHLLTPTVVAAGGLGAALLTLSGAGPSSRRWGTMTIVGASTTCVILVIGARSLPFYAAHSASMHPLLFVSAGALVQLGWDRMAEGRRAFALAAVAVFAAGILPSTVSHLSDGSRFDYRPAFEEMRATAPDIPILMSPLVQLWHYAPDLRPLALQLPENGATAPLDSMLMAHPRFWVVGSVRRYGLMFDDAGERARWLADHCRLKLKHERPRLDYHVYRVELYLCGQAV